MADIDTTALQDVKAGRSSKKKEEWAPFDLACLHDGIYLACDQSLAATGLVFLMVCREGSERSEEVSVRVWSAITLGTEETGLGGWADVLERTRGLERQMCRWIRDTEPPNRRFLSLYAVHEAPPIGGGTRFLKPELSLVTAYAFGVAVSGRCPDMPEYRLLPMVRPQDHKALTCGNANATKPVHHTALKRYFMPGIHDSNKVTNAATRDALAVALTAAYRGPSNG